jgi:hypothetical protein
MCHFLLWDAVYRLRCPLDLSARAVRIQSAPRRTSHFLEVTACSATPDASALACGKPCLERFENGEYWQEETSLTVLPVSVT